MISVSSKSKRSALGLRYLLYTASRGRCKNVKIENNIFQSFANDEPTEYSQVNSDKILQTS